MKSDFSRGMQVGIRYLCIKDIIIVDSINEDGSRQKTLTESECNATFRYKYELISRLNIDGEEAKEYVKSKESSAIEGREVQGQFKQILLALIDAEMVPATYIIKKQSTILLRRQVDNETVRTIDISLWMNLCPRTELSKQKNFLEFLIGVNYLSKYNFCIKCEVLKIASRKCDCLEAESDVDSSFDDEDESVFDEDDSSGDESL